MFGSPTQSIVPKGTVDENSLYEKETKGQPKDAGVVTGWFFCLGPGVLGFFCSSCFISFS